MEKEKLNKRETESYKKIEKGKKKKKRKRKNEKTA